MIGAVAAIVFGAIGAWVAVTRLVWDRRDRRTELAKEANEADRRAHEDERRRREEAQWQADDQEKDRDREFRVYSEAEARQFLNEHRPTMELPRKRSAATAYFVGALIVGIAAGILYWLWSR